MSDVTRRRAIKAGMISAPVFIAGQTQAKALGEKDVIVAGEKAVLFKLKDVTIESVDQPGRTITAAVGKQDERIRFANLPLEEDIRIRASFVLPSVANNLPFHWDRVKELVGKTVSIMLRAEASKLSVDAIASGND